MDLDEQRIWDAQLERMREIEGWLAMLIVRHGDFNGSGWEYVISAQAAQIMRDALPGPSWWSPASTTSPATCTVLTAL